MNEVIREFLLETHENLAQLDLDLVTLEKDPAEKETLSRVFRTLHTVKGTAGFLGLPKLQSIAHAGENLLSRLRAGELVFNPTIASALLGVVDAVRRLLGSIEATGTEGDADLTEMIKTLERLTVAPAPPPEAPKAAPATAIPEEALTHKPVQAPPPKSQVFPTAEKPAPPTPTQVLSPLLATPRSSDSSELRPPAVADSAIRVDVGLLDKLMNLVGELVLARNQIVQFSASQQEPAYLSTVQRLNLLTSELQTGVMKTRMQPIGNVWSKFPRVVRDLALACGKQVRLDMDGQETELDKNIIEAVRAPLTHLVRNAVDHGIEPPDVRTSRAKPAMGVVALHAKHEGGKVIIELADDGCGIDPQRVRDKAIQAKVVTAAQAVRLSDHEALNLVFLPGFSTADRVTQFSGRGVGMDVVRTNIEKIGGTVELESQPGQGTTVRMKIPLTLAIIPALTVACGGDHYAIPQVSLLELVRLEGEQMRRGIEWVQDAPVYRLRGRLLPLVRLHEQLQVEARCPADEVNIVVLQADDRQFGLVVDAIHDTEEIVVKPLQKQLKGLATFAGATIMGDGRVALILDVLGLAQRANVLSAMRERGLAEKTAPPKAAAEDRQFIVLFTAPDGGRMAIPLDQVARLEMFPRSAVERVGAGHMIQYRGEILPLVSVGRALKQRQGSRNSRQRRGVPRPCNVSAAARSEEPLPVVVYAREGRRVGLVVGSILDIVEEAITVRSRSTRPGVLFTTVLQDKVTEFLDIDSILRAADASHARKPHRLAAEVQP